MAGGLHAWLRRSETGFPSGSVTHWLLALSLLLWDLGGFQEEMKGAFVQNAQGWVFVLGASWLGVMPRNWGPSVGSASPWVELASLPPTVTWGLVAVIHSGDAAPPAADQEAGVAPPGLGLCGEPEAVRFATSCPPSPTLFSTPRGFSPCACWPRRQPARGR